MYTTKEVAAILRYKHETVRKKVQRGEIKAVKVGRHWLISKEEVDRILRGK